MTKNDEIKELKKQLRAANKKNKSLVKELDNAKASRGLQRDLTRTYMNKCTDLKDGIKQVEQNYECVKGQLDNIKAYQESKHYESKLQTDQTIKALTTAVNKLVR